MVVVARGLAALLLAALLGCSGPPRAKPHAPPVQPSAERTAMYATIAAEAHRAVVEALQGLGETMEEDRADGRYVQSASAERPDRTWIRTRVWISAQPDGGTRVSVRRSVVRHVSGHEVEWTSLPMLPEAGDEVLERLDRRLERATEGRGGAR